jgi:hypothetical protein
MQRSDLVFRLQAAQKLVTTEVIFIDDRVGDTPHNIRARFLRSGLIVQTYASLEAHLKHRFEQFCRELSSISFTYADFSDELKALFTLKAIAGLSGLLRRTERDDQLATSEFQLEKLGLHLSTPPIFTDVGFGYENSNLRTGDIETVVRAIGFNQPWQVFNSICADIGISTPSIRIDLTNFLKRRNQAAHDANVRFTTSDVEQSARSAFAIAICFDALFSHFVKALRASTSFADAIDWATANHFSYRFLDEGSDGKWRERTTTNGRAFRSFSDPARAKVDSISRARANQQILVIRNPSLQVIDWGT